MYTYFAHVCIYNHLTKHSNIKTCGGNAINRIKCGANRMSEKAWFLFAFQQNKTPSGIVAAVGSGEGGKEEGYFAANKYFRSSRCRELSHQVVVRLGLSPVAARKSRCLKTRKRNRSAIELKVVIRGYPCRN